MQELVRTPDGRLVFGNNEDAVEGFGPDAVKRRVAAQPGQASCISFNVLRPDGVEEEIGLIYAVGNAEYALTDFAVLLKDGDDLRRVLTIGPGDDGKMRIRAHVPVVYDSGSSVPPAQDPTPTPTPTPAPTPSPAPTPTVDVPTQITMQQGCTGTVEDIQAIGDGRKLLGNPYLDVRVEAPIEVTSDGTLKVEFIRNFDGDPAPYCYVMVDNDTKWNMQLSGPSVIAQVPIAAGTRKVKALVSAQNGGSCHIGGIVVSHV